MAELHTCTCMCEHINTHITLHCHLLFLYIQTYRSIVNAVKAKIRM